MGADDGFLVGGVAYGEAASVVLDVCIKPMPKLCTLVAYYPDVLPAPAAGYPPSLNVVVHLAGTQPVTQTCKSYSYPEAEPGFAELDLEEYDKVAAGLAWTRTLAAVRKGFEIEVDLERVWEEHVACGFCVGAFLGPFGVVERANEYPPIVEFAQKNADATMATMVSEPYVNHIPTLTGGIGYKDLHRFYKDYFIPGNPPSLKMRLISRTVGTDRVVDEMHVYFRHTQEVPWMLPGIAPTHKEVEVALVAIVCIRGGKLYHEHIYWDQASVLVQVGLLDPKLATNGKAPIRLPVVDGNGARKILDEKSVRSNELIKGW